MIPNGQKQITWCVKIRTYRIDLYKWNLPGGRKKLKKLINNNCCYIIIIYVFVFCLLISFLHENESYKYGNEESR